MGTPGTAKRSSQNPMVIIFSCSKRETHLTSNNDGFKFVRYNESQFIGLVITQVYPTIKSFHSSTTIIFRLEITMDSYSPLKNTYGTSRYGGNARNLYDVFLECIREETGGISRRLLEQAMHEIHSKYSIEGLEKKADTLDYNRIELRCAYVYLYCTCHVWMVIEAFEDMHFRKRNFMRGFVEDCIGLDDQLNVCSIGGGPGSDIVGTLVYLNQIGILENYHVKVDLVDGYPEWGKTFDCIMNVMNAKKLFPRNSPSVTFQDLLLGLGNITEAIIEKAHLVTMVKFVSAIYADRDRSEKLLRKIFNQMRMGAVLLLIDNSGGHVFDFAQKVAEMCGFEIVLKPKKHIFFQVDENLEPSIRLRNYEKPPQRSAKVSVVFMEKVTDMSFRQKRMGSSSSQRYSTNSGHERSYKKPKRRKRYFEESCPLDRLEMEHSEIPNALPHVYKAKKMPHHESFHGSTKSATGPSETFSGISSSTKEEMLTTKVFLKEASSAMSTPVQDELPTTSACCTSELDSENSSSIAQNSGTTLDMKDDLPPCGSYLKNDISKTSIVNLDSYKSTLFLNEAPTNDGSKSIRGSTKLATGPSEEFSGISSSTKEEMLTVKVFPKKASSTMSAPVQDELPMTSAFCTSELDSENSSSITQNSGTTLDMKDELPPCGSFLKNVIPKTSIVNLDSSKSTLFLNEAPTNDSSKSIRGSTKLATGPSEEFSGISSSTKEEMPTTKVFPKKASSTISTPVQDELPTTSAFCTSELDSENSSSIAQNSGSTLDMKDELPPCGSFLKNDIAETSIESSSDKNISTIPQNSGTTLDTKEELPQGNSFFKNDISKEPILCMDSDKAPLIKNENSSSKNVCIIPENSGSSFNMKDELSPLGSLTKNDIAKECIVNLDSDKSTPIENQEPTSYNSKDISESNTESVGTEYFTSSASSATKRCGRKRKNRVRERQRTQSNMWQFSMVIGNHNLANSNLNPNSAASCSPTSTTSRYTEEPTNSAIGYDFANSFVHIDIVTPNEDTVLNFSAE